MLNIDVIENRDGKPTVRWGAALRATCLLACFTTCGAVGGYYLLTGTFSPLAAIVGFAGAITAVVSGILRGLKNPAPDNRVS